MNGFSREERTDLRKIISFMKSSDKELNNIGLNLLRKSAFYRKMKPKTLFYYQSYCRSRVSNVIAAYNRTSCCDNVREFHRIQNLTTTMLSEMLDNEASKRFRREFINTAEIF